MLEKRSPLSVEIVQAAAEAAAKQMRQPHPQGGEEAREKPNGQEAGPPPQTFRVVMPTTEETEIDRVIKEIHQAAAKIKAEPDEPDTLRQAEDRRDDMRRRQERARQSIDKRPIVTQTADGKTLETWEDRSWWARHVDMRGKRTFWGVWSKVFGEGRVGSHRRDEERYERLVEEQTRLADIEIARYQDKYPTKALAGDVSHYLVRLMDSKDVRLLQEGYEFWVGGRLSCEIIGAEPWEMDDRLDSAAKGLIQEMGSPTALLNKAFTTPEALPNQVVAALVMATRGNAGNYAGNMEEVVRRAWNYEGARLIEQYQPGEVDGVITTGNMILTAGDQVVVPLPLRGDWGEKKQVLETAIDYETWLRKHADELSPEARVGMKAIACGKGADRFTGVDTNQYAAVQQLSGWTVIDAQEHAIAAKTWQWLNGLNDPRVTDPLGYLVTSANQREDPYIVTAAREVLGDLVRSKSGIAYQHTQHYIGFKLGLDPARLQGVDLVGPPVGEVEELEKTRGKYGELASPDKPVVKVLGKGLRINSKDVASELLQLLQASEGHMPLPHMNPVLKGISPESYKLVEATCSVRPGYAELAMQTTEDGLFEDRIQRAILAACYDEGAKQIFERTIDLMCTGAASMDPRLFIRTTVPMATRLWYGMNESGANPEVWGQFLKDASRGIASREDLPDLTHNMLANMADGAKDMAPIQLVPISEGLLEAIKVGAHPEEITSRTLKRVFKNAKAGLAGYSRELADYTGILIPVVGKISENERNATKKVKPGELKGITPEFENLTSFVRESTPVMASFGGVHCVLPLNQAAYDWADYQRLAAVLNPLTEENNGRGGNVFQEDAQLLRTPEMFDGYWSTGAVLSRMWADYLRELISMRLEAESTFIGRVSAVQRAQQATRSVEGTQDTQPSPADRAIARVRTEQAKTMDRWVDRSANAVVNMEMVEEGVLTAAQQELGSVGVICQSGPLPNGRGRGLTIDSEYPEKTLALNNLRILYRPGVSVPRRKTLELAAAIESVRRSGNPDDWGIITNDVADYLLGGR